MDPDCRRKKAAKSARKSTVGVGGRCDARSRDGLGQRSGGVEKRADQREGKNEHPGREAKDAVTK